MIIKTQLRLGNRHTSTSIAASVNLAIKQFFEELGPELQKKLSPISIIVTDIVEVAQFLGISSYPNTIYVFSGDAQVPETGFTSCSLADMELHMLRVLRIFGHNALQN